MTLSWYKEKRNDIHETTMASSWAPAEIFEDLFSWDFWWLKRRNPRGFVEDGRKHFLRPCWRPLGCVLTSSLMLKSRFRASENKCFEKGFRIQNDAGSPEYLPPTGTLSVFTCSWFVSFRRIHFWIMLCLFCFWALYGSFWKPFSTSRNVSNGPERIRAIRNGETVLNSWEL